MPASRPDDRQDLRRSLRDLVALTMLPTVWARYQPSQICADLVDVVARMIDADGVYLTSAANGCPELLWLRREDDHEIARLLREVANAFDDSATRTDAGHSALQMLVSPLSFQSGGRFVVGACRPGFPNEMERLILRVAVNQAATWLE